MAVRGNGAAIAQSPAPGPGHRGRTSGGLRPIGARLGGDAGRRAGRLARRRGAGGPEDRGPAHGTPPAGVDALPGKPELAAAAEGGIRTMPEPQSAPGSVLSCRSVPTVLVLLAAAAAAPRFQPQALIVEGDVASIPAADLD